MTALSPMQHFCDIPVVPIKRLTKHIAFGGPIWPDFDRQIAARHCRDGRPVDRRPQARGPMQRLNRPAVWGGVLDTHFGHLIAEHVSRLLVSLQQRPDDLYLFGLDARRDPSHVPDWIWQILEWYGLPRAQVHLLEAPLIAADLFVAPQSEMLGHRSPDATYIALLDQNLARKNLTSDPSDLVYVARTGLVAKGMGGHLGESYLVQALTAAGVRVMDPLQHSIIDQIAIYAGAKTLVFSEGSAIYGRVLLGRLDQDIHVLRRRPNQDLAAVHLAPRCQNLHYHAVVAQRLWARPEGRGTRYDLNVAFYDLGPLLALFTHLGYDLAWDHDAYRAAVMADCVAWLEHCPTTPEQLLRNIATIELAGFSLDAVPMPALNPLH